MKDETYSLGEPLANLHGTARALQAAENLWLAIEAEYGLLTADEVASILSPDSPREEIVSSLRTDGQLLAFRRSGAYVYPGFQFDVPAHVVLPLIAQLIVIAVEIKMGQDAVTSWLCSPSGYFHGDRPVEHLDSPDDLLQRFREAHTIEW